MSEILLFIPVIIIIVGIMSTRIIPRPSDLKRVESAGPWKLIYGRRKTGKSFLIKNFTKYDKFFFVNRDATVLDEDTLETYTWSSFFSIFKELLGSKKIVVDEFHRLPDEFQDFLHASGVKGELTLITSTLWLANKMLNGAAPLAGLVSPVRISMINERDVLASLSKELNAKEALETSVYLREPYIIPQFNKGNIIDFVSNYLLENKFFLKNLIGEIFQEEGKSLSKIYEGILKAVADGKRTSTEISSYLFARSLLEKDSPSMMPKYLDTLVEMGILEMRKVFGKKKFYYFHASPILDLHYYLEAKYSYVDVYTPVEFIKKVVSVKLPMHVEQFFRNLLAKHLGMKDEIIDTGSNELDIALLQFKKLNIVGEVKWTKRISADEIRSIENNLKSFPDARSILIVPDKNALERKPDGIEVYDLISLYDELGIGSKN